MRFSRNYKYAGITEFKKLNFDRGYNVRWGGGDEEVQQPQVPAAPSYSSTISDYIEQYPRLFDLLKQYAPQEAALSQQIQQQLYPETAGLQEQLAGVASQGMTTEAPSWYTQQTRDAMKSQFGRNLVYNPQAQEQYGIGTQQAAEDWKRYYQNLALTTSGRQALVQPTNQITGSYTPNQTAGYASNIYGTQANLYGQQSQNYWNQQNYSSPWANIGGTIAGGLGQGLGTIGGLAGYGYGANKGWW